ncbi:MAG: GNAT family N-acetyltransferase [Bacteroidia bacterium]|nr:GNAT family N-acetyltransferase [Bacteroidia bacterium]
MTVRATDWTDARALAWWHGCYTAGSLYRNTFFQSPEWVLTWKRHYVDTHPRREALLLTAEEQGRLIALAPLFLHTRHFGPFRGWRSLHLMGERLAQYPDIVTDAAVPEAVWTAILGYLEDTYPDAWLEIRDALPESTAFGLSGVVAEEGECYLRLPLRGLTPETLETSATDHMRRELSRARNRLATDATWHWEFTTAPDEAVLSALILLNRQRFGSASWFEDAASQSFFLDLCAVAGGESWCAVLRHEGMIVSILMGHTHGDSMLYLLSGMDTQYRSLSPGTMNLGRTIAHAAASGYAYFDFLRGEEAYKREFHPEERLSRHLLRVPPAARFRKHVADSARRLFVRAERKRRNA